MSAGGEHQRQVGVLAVERVASAGRRLDRAHARVGVGRESSGDAHSHATDHTPRVRPAVIAIFGPTGVGIDARFSVGEYAELVHAEIDGLLDAGRRPIVVGGTGLYLRAALADLDLRPPPPPGARERWEAEVAARGAPGLHAVLVERAPWAAEAIDPHDRQRIVRALELADAGELEPPEAESQLWTAHTRHPTLLVGLTLDRVELYARVDARVDAMLAAGAREEVLRAHAAGASETARKALGFQELLAGDVDAMKRRTRNFAKRQHTWMRKLADVWVLDVTGRGDEDVAAEIEELANTLRRP
ncbi:MAG: tRNA (adenosine(37)-N6)-dimethylallyltransferase MiaA [Actinobacteria bacterium]|nr:MAG: tRNA (adenosine(37)-N6)-dimethylallyltransferase MiaA [Actinomycetota bacterium]